MPEQASLTMTSTELAFLGSRFNATSSGVARSLGIPTEVDPAGSLALHGAQSLIARELVETTDSDSEWVPIPLVQLIGGAVASPRLSVLVSFTTGETSSALRFLGTESALLLTAPALLGTVRFALMDPAVGPLEPLTKLALGTLQHPHSAAIVGVEILDGRESTNGLAITRDANGLRWHRKAGDVDGGGTSTLDEVGGLMASVLRGFEAPRR